MIALQVGVSVGLFLIAVVFIRILLTELPRSAGVTAPGLEHIAVSSIPFSLQQRDEARTRDTIGRILTDTRLESRTDAIAVTSGLPFRFLRMGSETTVSVAAPDHPFVPPERTGLYVRHVTASPAIFEIVGTPVRFGRVFDDRDTAGAPPAVVVNSGLALDVFGTADVAGRDVLLRVETHATRDHPRIERATIVGVVAGGEVADRRGHHEDVLYTPFAQWFEPNLAIVARAASGAAAPVELLRDAIKRADPELAVAFLSRADVLAAGPLAFAPYLAALLMLLALLALVLAMAGLYGVLSHVVARRTRELGIRIALGAEPGRIARLVLKDGFRPIVEGLFIGLATAFVIRLFMKANLSLTIGPLDPTASGLAILLLALAGVVACYLPARRASRVDPNVTLRHL